MMLGALVVKSNSTEPFLKPSASPSLASATASNSARPGSDVNTTSHASATALGVAAHCAPEAMGATVDGEARKLFGVGGVATHRGCGPAVQFVLSHVAIRPRPHPDRGAEIATAPDDPFAEPAPLAIVARERRVEIAARRRDGVREAERIECCLRHPGTDVRPGHERGIAQDCHASEYHPRRGEVVDRLEERLLGAL